LHCWAYLCKPPHLCISLKGAEEVYHREKGNPMSYPSPKNEAQRPAAICPECQGVCTLEYVDAFFDYCTSCQALIEYEGLADEEAPDTDSTFCQFSTLEEQ
jgi:hypothetical protein